MDSIGKGKDDMQKLIQADADTIEMVSNEPPNYVESQNDHVIAMQNDEYFDRQAHFKSTANHANNMMMITNETGYVNQQQPMSSNVQIQIQQPQSQLQSQSQSQSQSLSVSDTVLSIKEDGDNFLKYLDKTTKLTIKQEIDVCCLMIRCKGQVNFTILDEEGNLLFYANEMSNCFCRQPCPRRRCFEMFIKDRSGRIMMKLQRKFDYSCFCGLLFADKISAYLPNFEFIGSILQNASFSPSYTMLNSLVQPIMTILGPSFYCTFQPGSSIEYKILDQQKRQVGCLEKKWSSCGQEFYSSYDNFQIQFPSAANPREKALCLASLILINIRQYETNVFNLSNLRFLLLLLPILFLLALL